MTSSDRQARLLKIVSACAFPVLIVLGAEWDQQGMWMWRTVAFLIATACAAVWFMLREKDLSRYRGRWVAVRVGFSVVLFPVVIALRARPSGGHLADVQYKDIAILLATLAVAALFVYQAYLLRARQLQG